MKVILNKCYGGFGVSRKAYFEYARKKGIKLFAYEDAVTGYRKSIFETAAYHTVYTTRDMGDYVPKHEFDWDSTIYLDEGHREDPVLIEVVKELGSEANGQFAKLEVVDIPDGMDYVVEDYDGVETLHEKVRTW